MVLFELSIIFFIILAVIALIIFRFVFKRRYAEIEDIDMNAPIGINLIPEISRGYFLLLEQKITQHISGALIIEAIPMDIKWRDENSPRFEPQIGKVKLGELSGKFVPLNSL